MTYKVNFTSQAVLDLIEIHHYFLSIHSSYKVEQLIISLKNKCLTLAKYPNRGHRIEETKDLVGNQYLEIIFKVYRIIYKIHDKNIYIIAIIDSRRDIQSTLSNRIIR